MSLLIIIATPLDALAVLSSRLDDANIASFSPCCRRSSSTSASRRCVSCRQRIAIRFDRIMLRMSCHLSWPPLNLPFILSDPTFMEALVPLLRFFCVALASAPLPAVAVALRWAWDCGTWLAASCCVPCCWLDFFFCFANAPLRWRFFRLLVFPGKWFAFGGLELGPCASLFGRSRLARKFPAA